MTPETEKKLKKQLKKIEEGEVLIMFIQLGMIILIVFSPR